MHSAAFVALVSALSLSVQALPLGGSDGCNEISTVVVTITGVPAPDTSDGYLTKVPAPEPTREYLTGVPAPESTSEYSTAVPATESTTGWLTGVPVPSRTEYFISNETSSTHDQTRATTIIPCSISPTGYNITGGPTPGSTDEHATSIGTPSSSGEDSTVIPLSESSTASILPTPTPAASCRPNWPSGTHTGTFRAGVIFVDFPDAPANTTISELYDPIASAPTELFNTMSYGKLDLQLVPLLDQFYRMPADSSSYGYSRGLTLEAHLRYIKDALTAAGPSASFANIDTLYIIPPKYADEISFSTSTGADVRAPDGSVISSTITFGQDLFFSWGPKTINHETGHAMGLPDLYPYAPGEETIKWVGGFDLMGLIGGQSNDLFAWHKWRLGWLREEQVVCAAEAGVTEHRISPIEVVDETRDLPKAIAIPTNSTGYVMVEVRSGLGADTGACGTGVLLYTADSSLGSGDGPVRVIDSKPGSGGCDADHGGELNDAPLQVGEEIDTGLGVIVRVKAQEWNDFVVEVERL